MPIQNCKRRTPYSSMYFWLQAKVQAASFSGMAHATVFVGGRVRHVRTFPTRQRGRRHRARRLACSRRLAFASSSSLTGGGAPERHSAVAFTNSFTSSAYWRLGLVHWRLGLLHWRLGSGCTPHSYRNSGKPAPPFRECEWGKTYSKRLCVRNCGFWTASRFLTFAIRNWPPSQPVSNIC